MKNLTKLSEPLLIKDKAIVGVFLPNTKKFTKALEEFIFKLSRDDFDEWDKELSSPEAQARYASIVADADANDGWVDGESFFTDLKKSRKGYSI